MFTNALLLALREIRRNMMRSILTAIGIVIGIASVIAMVNIGKGASQSITQSVSKLGSNTLYIMPGRHRGPGSGLPSDTKPFTMHDVRALKNSVITLEAVSPVTSSQMNVRYKETNYQTSVKGVDNSYFKTQNWQLVAGSFFDESELQSGKNVCILGHTVVTNLFGSQRDIVGEKIRLKNFSCDVIGVLESKGSNTFGMDQDDQVLVPVKMFGRRIGGSDTVPLIIAMVKEQFSLDEAKMQIRRLLREQRHIESGEEDNFDIRSMTALIDTLSKITGMLTVMLGAVAAISLVVGGIGIMNIMLVSVTERTREIGIRMAIGAMARDILVQFLIEAVVLSALGGIVGVLLGIGISVLVAQIMDIALIIDVSIVIIALLFSMLIGIVFGIIPARKAANMNPIDALRFE